MKTLLINGSPHERGSTYTALRLVADEIEKQGIEAEIYQIPPTPVNGCLVCGRCSVVKNNRCAVDGDAVNVILEKMEGSDALVLGSPVYYASPNGHLISVLDRVYFSGVSIFAGKPAAAVCAARRGGTTATLEVLQKYFTISGMPIASSIYWPMIHGMSDKEVMCDEEGVQTMQMIGMTLSWMLKCIEAGKAKGIDYPKIPNVKRAWTNFIR